MSKANCRPHRTAAIYTRILKPLHRRHPARSLVGQLHSRMNNLEASWRDQEQKKFAETFSQATKALAVFVAAAGEHSVFLNRKAAAIEQYLKQR